MSSFFVTAYEMVGVALLMVGLTGGLALMHPKAIKVHDKRTLRRRNALFAACGSLGIGLRFKLFGTEFGEWLLLTGDVLLVIAAAAIALAAIKDIFSQDSSKTQFSFNQNRF